MKSVNPKSKDLNALYEAILKLESADECKKFFRDLCTIDELKSMSERFAVVRMLEQGIPYRKISTKTGASTATVTRVAHWLHHGKGGYRLMLERL